MGHANVSRRLSSRYVHAGTTHALLLQKHATKECGANSCRYFLRHDHDVNDSMDL